MIQWLVNISIGKFYDLDFFNTYPFPLVPLEYEITSKLSYGQVISLYNLIDPLFGKAYVSLQYLQWRRVGLFFKF